MTISKAHEISLAIAARLERITVANGYHTDIGLRVMRGRRRIDPSQIPCAVIVERDDKVADEQGRRERRAKVRAPFALEGHAECDANHPNDRAHEMIADIKRAIFSEPFTFGVGEQAIMVEYAGRTISPREDGMAVVAAAVEIIIDFAEQLATP